MKLKKVCSTALLAALAAGTLLPAGASAATGTVSGSDGKQYVSEGKITYKQGNTLPGKPTDPIEGEDIDEPTPPSEASPLMIIGATSYTFAESLTTDEVESSTALKTYSAKAFEKKVGGSATGEYTPHFVEFRDIRTDAGLTDNRDYTLSAQVTKAFTNGASILNGAKIKYNNADVQSQKVEKDGSLTTPYTMGTKGTDWTVQSQFELAQTGQGAGNSVDIVKHTKADGFGRFHLVFGDNVANTALDSNVQLEVPADQVISNGTYTAEITWTIGSTFTPPTP